MIFSLFVKDIDPDEADDIPEGFVEKRRMNEDRTIEGFRVAKSHSPRKRRFAAERFAVAEVAPSAHRLTEHDGGNRHIAERKEGDLLSSRHIEDCERAEDNAAVNGKTAVPYGYDIVEGAENVFDKGAVGFNITAVKDDEVESCADDRGDNGDKRDIQHIVEDDGLLLCSEYEVAECGEDRKADDQSVPHDREVVTGDITVIAEGGTLWDFPRILNSVTLNGDLSVTLKNIDLMQNTGENGKMIQIAFGGVTVNGGSMLPTSANREATRHIIFSIQLM